MVPLQSLIFRAWSPDHTKMGKGITLSNEEFQTMVDAFKETKFQNERKGY